MKLAFMFGLICLQSPFRKANNIHFEYNISHINISIVIFLIIVGHLNVFFFTFY